MVTDEVGKGNGVDDMILTQIWKGYKSVEWLHLAQKRETRRIPVNTEIHLCFTKDGICLDQLIDYQLIKGNSDVLRYVRMQH
jgi:hypothetical protein